jgi:hypothetical protein
VPRASRAEAKSLEQLPWRRRQKLRTEHCSRNIAVIAVTARNGHVDGSSLTFSAADPPREEQRLAGIGVKDPNDALLAGTCADGRRKTRVGQFRKSCSGFFDRSAITGIENVPGVARAIHHNLDGHGELRLVNVARSYAERTVIRKRNDTPTDHFSENASDARVRGNLSSAGVRVPAIA